MYCDNSRIQLKVNNKKDFGKVNGNEKIFLDEWQWKCYIAKLWDKSETVSTGIFIFIALYTHIGKKEKLKFYILSIYFR